MIVCYQKSTKRILSIVRYSSKKHLDEEQPETDLNSMFPDMEDDVGESRFEETENMEVAVGGVWNSETNTQTTPPPSKPPRVYPHKERLEILKGKFDTGSATLIEVQEYLSKRDG